MNYIGETVEHRTLGTGTIIDQNGNKITVKFAGKEAKFVFPDCFESFLTLSDSGIQETAEEELQEKNEEKRRIEEAEAEEREAERTQRQILSGSSGSRSGSGKPRSSGSTGVYILNFQSPSTYAELSRRFHVGNKETNLEGLFNGFYEGGVTWSVPYYAEKGDTVLFHCAASSAGSKTIGSAIREAAEAGDHQVMEFGEQEQEKYKEYAGKIICIGELISDPENKYDENPSRMSYADIGNLQLLEEPIASKEISDYLPLNRFGSVTAVKQEQWAILKKLILERNPSISL